ncbi:MAG: phospholipid/cholesterol/gamma-HCH transport system substrate-binding protein, partial [Solirubrobacteraceae bacterium]|nr:phospholipid/cholesterol/gamma-HCH transport system substrate-binding protein [Solirubrobacteraceae bacterium]
MAIAALIAAFVVVGYVLLGGRGGSYVVHARFQDAAQLVKGNLVQVAGVPVGKIQAIDLTSDGQADVRMGIDDAAYRPLRQGTRAIIRQASLSGVANRYIDLQLPAADHQAKIPDGGVIDQSETTTAVDLDQLFNTFDPKTRKSLSGLIQGFAKQTEGDAGKNINAGYAYLSPSLAASSRLFNELTYDKPALTKFLVESSQLTGDLAQRKEDLAGLVDHLATTTQAIGREDNNLQDAIQELPPFMRRANTTFVNLRATLDDDDPLVAESKPVAKKLRPFLAELRPLARDARPTLRDLSAIIQSPGADNDLIE